MRKPTSSRFLTIVFAFLICNILSLRAQDITVKGFVYDETGEVLPGTVVTISGDPTKATMTDGNGAYSITAPVS